MPRPFIEADLPFSCYTVNLVAFCLGVLAALRPTAQVDSLLRKEISFQPRLCQ